MKPVFYREKWELLKLDPNSIALKSLAHRIASSFVDRYFYSDEYNESYVEMICDMATVFDDPLLNQIAAKTFFSLIVERLCDDFAEPQTKTYNRLICQVSGILRRLPSGRALNEGLNSFHLHTDEQLYQRIESMRLSPDAPLPGDLQPKKILILSRVTIGADVAVTSVICQRMIQSFPSAEIVVVGNIKLRQIFCPESGIRIHELHYARHGGLVERFSVWLDLLRDVRCELVGLEQNEYLVLDPDSRLTQLGVLPLVPDRNYRFFNSRGKQGYPAKGSISELTNAWLDNILGKSEFAYPSVHVHESLLKAARELRQRLDPVGNHKFITLNFGVGGNMRKRVPGDFESRMVVSLLRDPEVIVLLDMGFGEEELGRSEIVLKAAREAGIRTNTLAFVDLGTADPDARLVGVECSVGEIAALIAHSEEFIGYDSACQHIGAALGVRTFTVFAGTSNARFIRRWHACGPNLSEILYVDTLSREHDIDAEELIARLRDLRYPL